MRNYSNKLVEERNRRGWTRNRLQAELAQLLKLDPNHEAPSANMNPDPKRNERSETVKPDPNHEAPSKKKKPRKQPGTGRTVVSLSQIGVWERTGRIGSSFWVELVCTVYVKTPEELGLFVPTPLLQAPPQPPAPPPDTRVPPEPADAWVAPRDIAVLPLPPSSSGLVGREDEQQWLDTNLLEGKTAGIWAFAGMGGVGKTTIVADALPRLWPHFAGGVAVIRANEVTDVYVILQQLVEKFVPNARRFLDEELITRASLRTALTMALTDLVAHGQRVLVAIDNVEHDLIPKIKLALDILRAVGASVVITSREEIDNQFLDAKREIGILSDQAAQLLFSALALGNGVTPTLAQMNEIAAIGALVGNHAQALVLAAADFAQRPHYTVHSYRAHLEQAPNAVLDLYDRLDQEAPNGVRLTFASSFKWLPECAQRLFLLFGVLGGPSITVVAIEEIAAKVAIPKQECFDALDALIRAKLIRLSDGGESGDATDMRRIELHPLVQLFARELFADLSAHNQAIICEAFAWHYAQWIRSNPETILRPDDANFLAALTWACKDATHHTELVAQLTRGLEDYWSQRAQFDSIRQWLPMGLAAIERLGDAWLRDRATMAHSLARAYYHISRIAEARAYYQQSLRAYEELGDLVGQGLAWHSLGILTMHHGPRKEDAQLYLLNSLKTRRQAKDRAGEAQSLSSLGFLVMKTRPTSAARYFNQSLTIRRALKLKRDVGITLRGLGRLAFITGDYSAAQTHFSESLRIFRDIHFRVDEAIVLSYLGDIHRVRDELSQARDFYLDSLEISTEIGEGQAVTTVYYLLGLVALPEDIAIAQTYFEKSLENSTRNEHKVGRAYALLGLGLVAERQGDMSRAESYLRDAYSVAEGADDLLSLAEIAEALARLLLRLDPVQYRSEATRIFKKAQRQYTQLGQTAKVAQVKSELQALRAPAS